MQRRTITGLGIALLLGVTLPAMAARKGKSADRENRGAGGPKQREEHRRSRQGRNSGRR